MKMKTIEQKAKAYDEALIRGSRLWESDMITRENYEYIFPEVEESEDERIRKEIIAHIKWCEDSGYCAKEEMTRWITFLEKQGEQKETLCDKCNKEQPSHSCQDITALGRCALEKQGEQKSADKEYTFKAIPRLLEMIQPTDRAKTYCQKLIDSLEQEGYSTDAEIIRDCLKQMNGEKVAMATMDEQKPDKVEPKFHKGEWITIKE